MPSGDDPSGDDSSVHDRSAPDVDGVIVRDEWVAVAPDVRLHLRRWFPPAASRIEADERPTTRDVLLVHGLSSNARLWDQVAARLAAAGHEATAVDLRSHGESDAPDHGYDTATAVADVATIADHLGIAGAVVAGQSWGGNVVIRLAAERPDLVAAVALVDGGWFSPADTFDSWASAERRMRPPDVDGQPAAAMRARMRAGHPQWSDSAIEATVANLREEADGTIRRRLSIEHHMQIARSMWDDPPAPYYPRIAAPVLLMPALPDDPDAATPRRERIMRAAAALPYASITEYVGGDHDLHAQQPGRVADDLMALAARLHDVGALDVASEGSIR
jgi:pimeloyl-ACP methyl ester carboxylesterase